MINLNEIVLLNCAASNCQVRMMYSNPPAHGARVVAKILSDPNKYAQWKKNVEEMSGR